MAKRLISIVLMVTLVLTPLTAFAGAAETDSEIEELVQQQYEAFAVSKDFSGADERALWDMVLHALSGRGEKLVFDNNSAMTAVMLNSEMYKATVSEALAVAVTQMEWFTMDEMTLHGNAGWYDYQMRHQWVAYDEYGNHRGSVLKDSVFTGTLNDNDVAMILVVGSATSQLKVKRADVTDTETVYEVEFYLADDFDFDNTYDDMEELGYDVSLAEALTRIGKLLAMGVIDEYKWCIEATFQIRIPNHCDHAGKTYEWDFFNDTPYPVMGNGSSANAPAKVVEETEKGESVYYRLEETVHLFHDKPWTVEFEADSDSILTLASTADTTDGYPYLMKDDIGRYSDENGATYYRQTVLGGQYRMTGLSKVEQYILGVNKSYMGLDVLSGSDYECPRRTTSNLFRLENRVAEDGSNMVHLYVDGQYVGPLDEYYLYIRNSALRSGRRFGNEISGMDFEINYIGDRDHPVEGLHALRIWENGEHGEENMVDNGRFYEPTCTEEGFFANACRVCHKLYPQYYVDPTGHRYEQDLQMAWHVRSNSWTSRVLCSDCGEIGPDHESVCAVEPAGDGYLQIRIIKDALEKNSMRVASGCGTLDLTIPEDDPYLDMMAVSYDAEGRMVEVVSLSGEEITMLPLQDHTIKVLLLNKYTRAPLMPALVVSEEP